MIFKITGDILSSEIYFISYYYCHPSVLLISFSLVYIFHHFYLFVFLYLKWVSRRQLIVASCFFPPIDHLCLMH